MKGDSTVSTNADDEVDFHFICFIKLHKHSHVYQIDGDHKGSLNTEVLLESEEDIFAEALWEKFSLLTLEPT